MPTTLLMPGLFSQRVYNSCCYYSGDRYDAIALVFRLSALVITIEC